MASLDMLYMCISTEEQMKAIANQIGLTTNQFYSLL